MEYVLLGAGILVAQPLLMWGVTVGLKSEKMFGKKIEKRNATEMSSDSHRLTTYEFLRLITKDFSEDQIIGKGGSGVVYKGMLPRGQLIAVKKVETMCGTKELCDKSTKLFVNEFTLLMRLEHQNIVQLKEYCYEKKHVPSGRGENSVWRIDTLLCLEFYPKGSLKNHISDATSGFDWRTRYKIIEGISYGVQYLHLEQSEVPIIHMDLKPENILLDANMVPKIADFGISRLFDQGKTIHTNSRDGTPGYMPPEYFQGLITPMWDIFSLGVIIMEITTGYRSYPYDYNEASCNEYINTELDKWRNILEKKPGHTNLEADCQHIEKCIQIGLKCVNPERTERPTIRTIINMLQGLEECGPFTTANVRTELDSDGPDVEWLRWRSALSVLTAGCIILALIVQIIYQVVCLAFGKISNYMKD